MSSSLMITLALPIESGADDLLKFSQPNMAIQKGIELLELKCSPGSLGINQIQNPCLACTISDACSLQTLLGLWQDGGAVQRGDLVGRPELGQEVVNLKSGHVLYGMLLCPRDRD